MFRTTVDDDDSVAAATVVVVVVGAAAAEVEIIDANGVDDDDVGADRAAAEGAAYSRIAPRRDMHVDRAIASKP